MTTIFVEPSLRGTRKKVWRESADNPKPKGRGFRQRYEFDTYAIGAGFSVGEKYEDACRVRQAAAQASRRNKNKFVFRVRCKAKGEMYFAVRVK